MSPRLLVIKKAAKVQGMLPQYIITLGAHTEFRTHAGKSGKFEAADYKIIEKIVRKVHGFQGCTIIRAQGFYEGREEDTVQITILEKDYAKIVACAQQLRETFRQNEVLVVSGGVGEFLRS